MTEKLPPLTTQIVLPSQSAPLSSTLPSAPDASQHKVETVEEEPYTIKCICSFSGDDGNTIFCETCDTWQHIECFYPNNVEDAVRPDFAHSCAECKPRPLDRQQAFERQRLRAGTVEVREQVTDKKPKRPPSKSHKKKPKPTDLQLVNGHLPAADAAKHNTTQDGLQPPVKKAKTSHKPSHSVSSQATKRSPPCGTGRAGVSNGHPPSPATTPPELPQDFEIHTYTPEFVSLFDDKKVQIVQMNSFASLNISNTMSLWLREPEKLRQETGWEYSDVFQPLPPDIETLKQPVRLETQELQIANSVVKWNYLTTPAAVEHNVPLIELNGLIGFQKDYSADKNNRWDEFTSPLPFVFFLEMLPLYIDTRSEGSRARYVRRSCKPNAVIDTFLSEGSEYHFWLVSDRHIKANEQITIAWDFRFPKQQKSRMLRLLGLGDEDAGSHDKHEIDEVEYQNIHNWVHLMLSEYGGCACDLGNNCAFVRFHRNHLSRSQSRLAGKKKQRKPKTHTVSPTSTGHATNSRAASEGRLDDGAEVDVVSMSGSARSKPPSRDMTPALATPAPRQGSFDTLGILTEPTDRDKRKVAMVEDSFRRMEQHQPPRKKKRVSDGATSANASSRQKTKAPPGQTNGSQYVDAGTCGSKSESPVNTAAATTAPVGKSAATRNTSALPTSRQASTTTKPSYVDASVQTDPEPGQWYSDSPALVVRPKKRYTSLSKRLLEDRHLRRQEEEERRKKRGSLSSQSGPSDTTTVASPTSDAKPQPPSPILAEIPVAIAPQEPATTADVPMPDAPASPPIPPVVVTEPAPSSSPAATKAKAPELKVQMPPPPPVINGNVSAISTATTPVSAVSSIAQSPLSTTTLSSPFSLNATSSTAAAPSPVKKKLSLSDYTKSRKAAGGRPSVGTSLKAAMSNPDDPKSATSVGTPSVSDSPSAANAGVSLIPPADPRAAGAPA
ncbi:hypothetical protein MAPG_00487 [Magnaporthiopsis poae ATCC 64411]|uniref:SET domain-containing protein n=1 Tax=Magnaporthiopsis poae (strain ATCC 64411 / 73-15) TaxID=644358 RepID=A0A0C4DL49_MAGP6|nr:hypothetical protein MAPG_00487 [Magnaporthiopsis poae ATCC 64411]